MIVPINIAMTTKATWNASESSDSTDTVCFPDEGRSAGAKTPLNSLPLNP